MTKKLIHRQGVQAVVVDYSMPGMRGDKLISLFRRQRRLQDLVLVLISGKDREELEGIARALDRVHVVAKSELRFGLASTIASGLSRVGVRTPDDLWQLRYPSRIPQKKRMSRPPRASSTNAESWGPPKKR